jgi:hypothetical protein
MAAAGRDQNPHNSWGSRERGVAGSKRALERTHVGARLRMRGGNFAPALGAHVGKQ